jgi:hypothetical protein
MKGEEETGLDAASAPVPVAKRRYEPPQLTPETRAASTAAKPHSIIETHAGTSISSGPS